MFEIKVTEKIPFCQVRRGPPSRRARQAGPGPGDKSSCWPAKTRAGSGSRATPGGAICRPDRRDRPRHRVPPAAEGARLLTGPSCGRYPVKTVFRLEADHTRHSPATTRGQHRQAAQWRAEKPSVMRRPCEGKGRAVVGRARRTRGTPHRTGRRRHAGPPAVPAHPWWRCLGGAARANRWFSRARPVRRSGRWSRSGRAPIPRGPKAPLTAGRTPPPRSPQRSCRRRCARAQRPCRALPRRSNGR